jgi:hypothetical protein
VRRLSIFAVPVLLALLLGAQVTTATADAAMPFADSCLPEAPEEGTVGNLNHNPGARHSIVPAGAVSLRICRYYGFGLLHQTPKTQARVGKLRDQADVRGHGLLESLTLEFKELETVEEGSYNCPLDEGAVLYAVFSYPAAEPVILEVGLSGCEWVENGGARGRWLNPSLEKRLTRLVEGRRAGGPSPVELQEKKAVAYPPPHLSFAYARREARATVEEGCQESMLCSSWRTGKCRRKSARGIVCGYTAELTSGEVCRGGISIGARRGGLVEVSPGTADIDEGECFYLFAPAGFKEELEEDERERAEEAAKERERPKR